MGSIRKKGSANGNGGRTRKAVSPEKIEGTPTMLFKTAQRFHQAGHRWQAESVSMDILARDPRHADTLHLLGVMRAQEGRYDEARRFFGQALASDPAHAMAHFALGCTLQQSGRHEDALASIDRALALDANHAEAFFRRAAVLQALHRHAEAFASCERALALYPGHAEAHNKRGVLLRALGRHAEALASYDRAINIRPGYAAAHNNRGNVLQELGRHEEAIASYDHALAVHADHKLALEGRGISLRALNRHREALANYDKALAAHPGNARAWSHRGISLMALGRYHQAAESFGRALEQEPAAAGVLCNRGNALYALKRYNAAISCYRQALAADAGQKHTLDMLIYLQGHVCDWAGRARSVRMLRERMKARDFCVTPFAFLGISDNPDEQLAVSTAYFQELPRGTGGPMWKGERYGHDRIRIAYLSADFHGHATSYLMAGLFERHDRSKFEITAISFGPASKDEMRLRLTGGFDRFIDVRCKSDAEAAALIRGLEIDIAVDLKGYTTDARPGILALRPAPLQVNYLGYPGTMGADCIDYIVADEFVIPRDLQVHFSEKVVYLPGCYQVNDDARRIAERTPTRAEAGLPEQGFVFCCFNNSYKLTRRFFNVWMRLLRRVEGSTLWLLNDHKSVVRNLRREAQAKGVDPERLVFAGRIGLEQHLARHRLADLFLDTLPFNAHTTASDALWAGLPVLTCAGKSFAGRVAGSLLHVVGMPELVTSTLEDYEALALRLARDGKLLREYRQRLARNRATALLFNTDLFRRHIESAYQTMWQLHERGEAPRAFEVGAVTP